MPTSTLDLETRDGACKTELVVPDCAGPWPAVIFCYDAAGARPAMSRMAARIAAGGYVVAMPDLYHRVGSPFDLLPAGTPRDMGAIMKLFSDAALRQRFSSELMASAVSYDHLRTTVGALLDHLDARADVAGGVGTTGYCMGGNVSFRIATVFGERIRATASFHGGHLATAAPDSPHLRAAAIKSRVYVAGAADDASFTDAMKQQLVDALTTAEVAFTVETYPARHGFAVPDNPAFDAACAERHYAALTALYSATLGA